MNAKFKPDDVLVSQYKGTNKMFERDVMLVVCDTIGHFLEF